MQRRATKNTRGANAQEKAFQGWLKYQPCYWCNSESGSIVDHCKGATFKHNKVLIGHWMCNSNCLICDTQKTIHGKRLGNESDAAIDLIDRYEQQLGYTVCPGDVRASILDWGR